ncbi:MAG TPA: MaoC family dehydratase [Acetobacteraceae bacterium]
MTDDLYWEDVGIGQVIMSRTQLMTRDRIVAFAEEFDPQPQHLNEEAARSSLFGELVASGWHTASVTMRLQLEAMMGRFPGGSLGAQIDTLTWRRPVRPGDELRAQVEVLAKRPSGSRPSRGLLTLRTTTLNQRDETVQEMTASILVPRRPV